MSRRGWTLFLVMAVIWGIPYLLIRVAVRQLDPGVMVLLRTAPASLLLAPIVIARRQIPVLLANARWIIVFAVVEFGIPWYCMSTAEKHISSSLTSLLICCVPLFAVLVAARTTHRRTHLATSLPRTRHRRRRRGASRRTRPARWVDHVDRPDDDRLSRLLLRSDDPGDEVGARARRRRGGRRHRVRRALLDPVGASSHWPTHVSGETWSCMAVLSVVCTATAFLVFFELVKEVGSSRSVVVTYFNTAIAVVLGIVGLHEALTAGILLGFPLVLVGCILATSRSKVPASSELLGVLSGDADLAVDQHPE